MKNSFTRALLALSLFAVTSAAQAIPVKWTLSGVTFNDGGTASGSYVYDADTSSFSQIQVSTTAGTIGTAVNFSNVCTSSADCFWESLPIAVGLIDGPTSGDLTSSKVFYLALQGAMTNLGGTLNVAPGAGGTLSCTDPTCRTGLPANLRNLSGGSVVGILLPPPAATASPTSVDFGSVPSGQNSAPSIVTLENTGGSPLTLSAAPTTNGDFVIEGTTCSVGLVLAPTENCQVTLKMAPTSVATLTGELSFAHDATPSSTTVALRGVGTPSTKPPTAATAVPSLSTIALAMLSVMLAALGYRSSRRKF